MIWNQFRWHFRLQLIPVLSPVHSDHLFTLSVVNKAIFDLERPGDCVNKTPLHYWHICFLQPVNSSFHLPSVCARHGVLQCKLIHRVHWSKSKLACIYPDMNPNCDKCHQGPANLSHMFWSCLSLAPFWTCIFDSLSAITSANIQPSPLLALLGVLPIGISLWSCFAELVAFLTLLARHAILLQWKSPPNLISIVKECSSFYEIGKK